LDIERKLRCSKLNIKIGIILAISVVSVLLSSCQQRQFLTKTLYTGSFNKEEVSVLKTKKYPNPREPQLQIFNVDGKDLRNNIYYNLNTITEIRVLPGKHTVTFYFNTMKGFTYSKLWFVAEAGKEYIAKAEVSLMGVRIWIEEVGTGKLVGGISGSEDEPE
jgi:hypothetical protein